MRVGTTPSWLRVPVLAGLLSLGGYFFACYWPALDPPAGSWARAHPWGWWFGNWQMFTLLDTGQSLIVAEQQLGGRWEPVALAGLFPTRWESGPRYARSSFFGNPEHMAVLGAATCGRLPVRPQRVRFFRVTWPKQLGEAHPRPPRKARRRELLDWDCARAVSLPAGRRW